MSSVELHAELNAELITDLTADLIANLNDQQLNLEEIDLTN
jgi:hypothetical protein